jgi:hypothetical protein
VNSFSAAKCLAERCLLEGSLLRYPPSELACAVAYLTRQLHLLCAPRSAAEVGAEAAWTAELQGYTGRSEEQLLPCARDVQVLLQRELFASTRHYAHQLLAGSDCSFESLLRTLSGLAGNNARSGLSLQPFSLYHQAGRISADLQAYHDALPLVLLELERRLLKELGLAPLPTPAPTPAASQTHAVALQLDHSGDKDRAVRLFPASPAAVTATASVIQHSGGSQQSRVQAAPQSLAQLGGLRMHVFETFGKAYLSSHSAAATTGATQEGSSEEVCAAAAALSQLSASWAPSQHDNRCISDFDLCRLSSQGSLPSRCFEPAALHGDSLSCHSLPFLPGGLLLGRDQLTALTSVASQAEFPPLVGQPPLPPRKGLSMSNPAAGAVHQDQAHSETAWYEGAGCYSTDDFASAPGVPSRPGCGSMSHHGASTQDSYSLPFVPTLAVLPVQQQDPSALALDAGALPPRRRFSALAAPPSTVKRARAEAVNTNLALAGEDLLTPLNALKKADSNPQAAPAPPVFPAAPAVPGLTLRVPPLLQAKYQLPPPSGTTDAAAAGGEALLTHALKHAWRLPALPVGEVVRQRYRAHYHKLMPCHPY